MDSMMRLDTGSKPTVTRTPNTVSVQTNNLVDVAKQMAQATNTMGFCARGVERIVTKAGLPGFHSPDARTMASKMGQSGMFDKIPLSQAQRGDFIYRAWSKATQTERALTMVILQSGCRIATKTESCKVRTTTW